MADAPRRSWFRCELCGRQFESVTAADAHADRRHADHFGNIIVPISKTYGHPFVIEERP